MKKMLLITAIVFSTYGMDNGNPNQEEVARLEQRARQNNGGWEFREEDAECCLTVIGAAIVGIWLKGYLEHEHQE